MKLLPDPTQSSSVTGYGPDWVAINGEKYTASLVISTLAAPYFWECARFEDLQPSHFERLAAMDTELVIFGSGARIRFAQPALMPSLDTRRIGVETMDTPAAARTHHFLAGEYPRVVAALLL